MPYQSGAIDYLNQVDSYKREEPSFMWENMKAAALTYLETESFLGRYQKETPIRALKKEVKQAVQSGLISGEELEPLYLPDGRLRYDEVVQIMKDRNIATSNIEDFRNMNKREITKNLANYQDLQSRATFGGKVGGFIGSLGMALNPMTDPLYIPTYFVGLGGLAKGIQATRLLKTAGKVATVEAAVETVKQFTPDYGVYQWKKDLGIDYGVPDAVKTIAFSAGIAGAIPLTIGGLALGLRKLRKSYGRLDNLTKDEMQALKDIDALERDARNAPDPNMDAEEYFSKRVHTERSIEAEPTAHVRDLPEDTMNLAREAEEEIPDLLEADLEDFTIDVVEHSVTEGELTRSVKAKDYLSEVEIKEIQIKEIMDKCGL